MVEIVILAVLPVLILLWRHYLRPRRLWGIVTPELMIVIPIIIGTTLRSLYLENIFNIDSDIIDNIRFGLNRDDILKGLVLTNFAVIAYCCGSLIPKSFGSSQKQRYKLVQNKRLIFVIVTFYVLSLIALFQLLRVFDLQSFVLSEISGKKRIIVGDGVRISFGYYRYLISFALYGGILSFFVYFHTSNRRQTFLFLGLFGVFLVGIISIIVSSRMELVTLFAMIILIQFANKKFSKLSAIFYFLVISISSSVILSYRHASTQGVSNNSIIESIVGNNNMTGIVKLGLIYKKMDKLDSYKFGSTYLNWMLAPVPRKFWPEKPAVSIGLTMRKEIMPLSSGSYESGIPPSIFAEAYWNFGLLGILGIPILWGYMLDFYYRKLMGMMKAHIYHLDLLFLLYIYWNISFRLASEDFSYVAVDSLKWSLAVLIVQRFTHK